MKKPKTPRLTLDQLIDQTTADANGEAEQFTAFLGYLSGNLKLPCAATLMGNPVQIVNFNFNGDPRRGVVATCLQPDGSRHSVAACDLNISSTIPGADHLAAYRQWMGLVPYPKAARPAQAGSTQIPDASLELVVVSVVRKLAFCRLFNGCANLSLKTKLLNEVFPAEIVVVSPAMRSTKGDVQYVEGPIVSSRLDVPSIGLIPLTLEHCGFWVPSKHFWGAPADKIGDWAKSIIAAGRRKEYELQQPIPRLNPTDPDYDPIDDSIDRVHAGDTPVAIRTLMKLCAADIRCLDAHAHLGNIAFDQPKVAIRHYEAGVRIGELSLTADFNGLLPWGLLGNRPFLRCMSGYGLCLWRLRRFDEAHAIFNRMLWLNPSDNQGIRLMIDQVRDRELWEHCA